MRLCLSWDSVFLLNTDHACLVAEKSQGRGSGTGIDQAKESVSVTLLYKEMMAGNAFAQFLYFAPHKQGMAGITIASCCCPADIASSAYIHLFTRA